MFCVFPLPGLLSHGELEKWQNLGSTCDSQEQGRDMSSPCFSQSSHCTCKHSEPSITKAMAGTRPQLSSFCSRVCRFHSISPLKRMEVSFGSNFFLPIMGVIGKVLDKVAQAQGNKRSCVGKACRTVRPQLISGFTGLFCKSHQGVPTS